MPSQPKWRRILVYQNSALGDALYATPAIRALRETFPQAHLALLCRDKHADLMAQNPHLDQLLVYRGKTKSFRLLTGQMKANRFDVAVVSPRKRSGDLGLSLGRASETYCGTGEHPVRFFILPGPALTPKETSMWSTIG